MPSSAAPDRALVPALHGAHRRQQFLGEVVGGGLGGDVAAPLDAAVDDVAVSQHEVRERVREREPLQDDRPRRVDEDERRALDGERGGHRTVAGGEICAAPPAARPRAGTAPRGATRATITWAP